MNEAPPKLRCLNHSAREAAARCAGCSQFFCSECVTEYELQMLCADCLTETTKELKKSKKTRPWLMPVAVTVQLILGLLLVWMSFYMVGRLVIAVPSDFHEGTLWEKIQMGGAP